MDGQRFDRLAKKLATGSSRRQAIKFLLGLGGAASVAVSRPAAIDARRRGFVTGDSTTTSTTTTTTPRPCQGTPCGLDCCATPEQCSDGECCPDGSFCVGEEVCCPTELTCAGACCDGETEKCCEQTCIPADQCCTAIDCDPPADLCNVAICDNGTCVEIPRIQCPECQACSEGACIPANSGSSCVPPEGGGGEGSCQVDGSCCVEPGDFAGGNTGSTCLENNCCSGFCREDTGICLFPP